MSFGSVAIGSGAETSSVLRYGLTTLKPIRVREIIKRWGLRFERVFTTFQPVDVPKSYSDYVNLKYRGVFSNIDIPEHFEAQKLVEYYSNESIRAYKEDKEYLEELENLRRSKGQISPLIDFVTYCKKRYQQDIHDMYATNANNFFVSDIPFIVFSDLTRSDHVFALFLNLLHDTLYYYNRRLSLRARSDEKYFYRVFGMMKAEVNEIIDIVDNMLFNETCLKRLLIVWNAETYDDLEKIEHLTFHKIPKDEFERIFQNLRYGIKATRLNILRHKRYREDKILDIKPPTSQFQSKEFLKDLFFEGDLRVS